MLYIECYKHHLEVKDVNKRLNEIAAKFVEGIQWKKNITDSARNMGERS